MHTYFAYLPMKTYRAGYFLDVANQLALQSKAVFTQCNRHNDIVMTAQTNAIPPTNR